jgi:hypothetical protein
VNAVRQVCYTDVGMDGNSSMSSCSESRGSGMNDRAYSYQSTEGSKVCTYSDYKAYMTTTTSLHQLSFIFVIYCRCI